MLIGYNRGVKPKKVPVHITKRMETAWEGYGSTKRLIEWYMVCSPAHSAIIALKYWE